MTTGIDKTGPQDTDSELSKADEAGDRGVAAAGRRTRRACRRHDARGGGRGACRMAEHAAGTPRTAPRRRVGDCSQRAARCRRSPCSVCAISRRSRCRSRRSRASTGTCWCGRMSNRRVSSRLRRVCPPARRSKRMTARAPRCNSAMDVSLRLDHGTIVKIASADELVLTAGALYVDSQARRSAGTDDPHGCRLRAPRRHAIPGAHARRRYGSQRARRSRDDRQCRGHEQRRRGRKDPSHAARRDRAQHRRRPRSGVAMGCARRAAVRHQ